MCGAAMPSGSHDAVQPPDHGLLASYTPDARFDPSVTGPLLFPFGRKARSRGAPDKLIEDSSMAVR